MSQTISKEQEEKTKVKLNIYRVPIEEPSFVECLGNEIIHGGCFTHCYTEGKSVQDAVLNLIECPDYWKNWNSYAPIVRNLLGERGYKPFKINLEKNIEQIPQCGERHKTKRGDYVCGPPSTNGEYDIEGINGEFGDCICTNCWTNKKEDLRQCCPYRSLFKD